MWKSNWLVSWLQTQGVYMILSLNRKMLNLFTNCYTFLSSENLVLDKNNVT